MVAVAQSIQFTVPDDFAFDHVDHFLGDIGGMIGKALQVPGDKQQIDQFAEFIRMVAHGQFDTIVCIFLDFITNK